MAATDPIGTVDPKNWQETVEATKNLVGRAGNEIKDTAENMIPGLKGIDKKFGEVIDDAKEKLKPGVDKASKFIKGMDPDKALKGFDPSNGTASIGANVAKASGLSDTPKFADVKRPTTPSQATQAAQAKLQKDLG